MKKLSLQKNTHQPASESGFSLIEILIALVIFSVGILGVASMQISATKGNTTAGVVTANVADSVDRIEKLVALGYQDYDDPNMAVNAPATPHEPAQDEDFIDNDEDGEIDEEDETGFVSIRWDVTETVPQPGSDLYNYKTITVTITRDVVGQAKEMTLTRNIPNIVGD